jgi:nucleoside phosphorylase
MPDESVSSQAAGAMPDSEWMRIRGRLGKAQVAIITILPEERDAVKVAGGFEEFAPSTSCMFRNELATDVYDVILAKAPDRGNTPCAELVSMVVERFRPEFIILSGIAGGVGGRDDVALGDIVVADHVDWYEMRKMAGGKDAVRRQAIDHPSSYLRDTIVPRVSTAASWIAGLTVARPSAGTPKVIEGNLIAGEKVLGDDKNRYQKKVLKEFDKALAVDMESYGLGRAVYTARGVRRYNLGYLVVRGISDLVGDPENNATRGAWRDYAAAVAAGYAIAIANEIIAAES